MQRNRLTFVSSRMVVYKKINVAGAVTLQLQLFAL